MDASPWIPACELEAIHMPGAIQPCGALLMADLDSHTVVHASANLAEFLPTQAASVIGRPLQAVLGSDLLATLFACNAIDGSTPTGVLRINPAAPGRPALTLIGRRLDTALLVEIEPECAGAVADGALSLWAEAPGVVHALRAARTSTRLFATAVATIRRVTGFDRAMLYRFEPSGHGEVIAEDRAPELEPFLGIHYPASDVPRQARQLYLRQRVRMIADVGASAVPLLGAPAAGSPDLSFAALRAVSPVHLEYLRNMGVAATVAVSLLVNRDLWGLLVCHNRQPRAAPSPFGTSRCATGRDRGGRRISRRHSSSAA
jgi:light-regulated signal transduction histidine kinase (bacteriophytochrome)